MAGQYLQFRSEAGRWEGRRWLEPVDSSAIVEISHKILNAASFSAKKIIYKSPF
jgi:hypothetical protein